MVDSLEIRTRELSEMMLCFLAIATYCISTDMFVDKLFSNENRIPTFLWNNNDLFRHLHEIYRECDNSVISLARELKSVLNRYFAKPGEKTTD